MFVRLVSCHGTQSQAPEGNINVDTVNGSSQAGGTVTALSRGFPPHLRGYSEPRKEEVRKPISCSPFNKFLFSVACCRLEVCRDAMVIEYVSCLLIGPAESINQSCSLL